MFSQPESISAKIEGSRVLRFTGSCDVKPQGWKTHAVSGEADDSSAQDGYMASIAANALIKPHTSGTISKIVTSGAPDFCKK